MKKVISILTLICISITLQACNIGFGAGVSTVVGNTNVYVNTGTTIGI